jgi:hypothetical protein
MPYAHGGLCPMPTEAYAQSYLIFVRKAIGANKHYMGRAGECIHLLAYIRRSLAKPAPTRYCFFVPIYLSRGI